MAEPLAKGSRVTGPQRAELATELGRRYTGGESIRALAEGTGRSFGFVHGLIKEAGVAVRGRGGATRGAAAKQPVAPSAPPTGAASPQGAKAAAAAKSDKKPKAKKSSKNDDGKKSKKGKKR